MSPDCADARRRAVRMGFFKIGNDRPAPLPRSTRKGPRPGFGGHPLRTKSLYDNLLAAGAKSDLVPPPRA